MTSSAPDAGETGIGTLLKELNQAGELLSSDLIGIIYNWQRLLCLRGFFQALAFR
jgi:hypothetical protein